MDMNRSKNVVQYSLKLILFYSLFAFVQDERLHIYEGVYTCVHLQICLLAKSLAARKDLSLQQLIFFYIHIRPVNKTTGRERKSKKFDLEESVVPIFFELQ